MGGFLLTAQKTGLPLRLFEIGSSAGLNLLWDHYRYEFGGWHWGNPESPVQIASTLLEGQPPLNVLAHVVERCGCDLNPLDPSSVEDCLTLMSYVPPDQVCRVNLLKNALSLARTVPVSVEKADAIEWLRRQLANRRTGVATVLFHSFVMQYISAAGLAEFKRLITEAGSNASEAAPFAWLYMDHGKSQPEVRLTFWPGGTEYLLATAENHGQRIRWLAAA
jgi:hypothetical protein